MRRRPGIPVRIIDNRILFTALDFMRCGGPQRGRQALVRFLPAARES